MDKSKDQFQKCLLALSDKYSDPHKKYKKLVEISEILLNSPEPYQT